MPKILGMARAALALPFSGISGVLGDTVVVQLPDGPQVRRRTPVRRAALSSGQAAGTARMALVSRAWATLDEAAFRAWAAYALGRRTRNPATGAWVTPKAYALFVGHACKARQIDPERDLTRFFPPERAFTGDGVVVTVSLPLGRGRGGVESVVEGADVPSPDPLDGAGHEARSLDRAAGTPTLPSPKGEGSALLFSADRGNAEGVVTELMGQPLANARRAAYRDKYASLGFVAFEGAETVEVPLAAGAWALAYRFVRPLTGEETAIYELGVVTVGG